MIKVIITEDMIEKAKVAKQMRELVAFYSVKDQKPFFFISPSEARIAIDYVKNVRSGFIQDKEDEATKDAYVRKYLENYEPAQGEVFHDPKIINLYTQKSELDINILNIFFANMEGQDFTTDAIILNAVRYADIRSWGQNIYDEYTYKTIKERGCFGRIWTAEIYVSRKIFEGSIITMDTTRGKVVTNILSL